VSSSRFDDRRFLLFRKHGNSISVNRSLPKFAH
jgi:hypothetical protein